MKTALFCKNCNARLSNWLCEIDNVEAMNRLCDLRNDDRYEEEIHPVPKGHVLVIANEVLHERQKAVPGWNPEGHAEKWMNLGDIVDCVGLTDDTTRLNGCCGLDGGDGPNRVCSCDSLVGTESSDCWTWHQFIPNPKATYWKT
ncbi:hypothetical protein SAMN04488030_0771 [Aliiroseovarius halocynthiae]|uniref:Uncharacterized protein n=1 Tax=Aliiroseovarius halocynthiae TaxID=985055 RepID=A0A545SUU7_9RHOB|nr:hypothetical protein [Aliiroseovarius halocynthiae]TQV68726.1 hypothetical protein FIL88_03850 [Aliiroseovarius halocynthiae]SMR71147.1 hypothetical protein SAMN04488030_0771 [Aliiroseovarius halocynthiae]